MRTTRKQRAGSLPGGITGRGFRAGQSGNPGGRPRGFAAQVRAETRDGQEIVDVMLKVLRDGGGRIADRIEAAKWLGDRGWGRPAQSVEPLVPETDGPRRIVLDWGDSPA